MVLNFEPGPPEKNLLSEWFIVDKVGDVDVVVWTGENFESSGRYKYKPENIIYHCKHERINFDAE